MEKQLTTKSINMKILKFLPKASQAAVTFQLNPPFSPGRDKLKPHMHKGLSGPMISAEARTKSKDFQTPEPTSPKVSCMGQIKHKNKICRKEKKKQTSLPRVPKRVSETRPEKSTKTKPELKKQVSGLKKLFGSRSKSTVSTMDRAKPSSVDGAPSLSQVRRYASSRDTLANFDWTKAQIAPEEDRDTYSDEERGYSDYEEEVVVIPFSAPMFRGGVVGGGESGLGLEPRKEINLWKRRTMAQPKPLQLTMVS